MHERRMKAQVSSQGRSCCRKNASAAIAAKNAERDADLATELATGHEGVFAFLNGSLGDSAFAAAEQRHRCVQADLVMSRDGAC